MKHAIVATATLVVALVLAAPAVADTAVEVLDEATGSSCDSSLENCDAHLVSDGHVEITGHLFGFEAHQLDCDVELDVVFDGDGSGTVDGFAFTGEDSGCASIAECDTPWPLVSEETASEDVELLVTACFDGTALGECAGTVDVLSSPTGAHALRLELSDERIGTTFCELTGTLDSEGSDVELGSVPPPPPPPGTAVEVVEEASESHCEPTPPNCEAHVASVGHWELTGHAFGFESHQIDCDMEFTIQLAEDGTGKVDDVLFAGEDTGCSELVDCGAPWPFSSAETSTDTGALRILWCFDGSALGACQGATDLTFSPLSGGHGYSLSASDQRIGATFCEIAATWVTEGTDFEILHL